MISAAIQRVLAEKSGSFLIPASKIAIVEEDNPLYHAFLILTKVKYAKIPVLNKQGQITGLLSLAMITDKMLDLDGISVNPLNKYKVKDVMVSQTGCIGLCQYEPIVEVYEPGKEKVTYVHMDKEKAE